MWISKKKWNRLEKRIADLEGKVQSQLTETTLPRLRKAFEESLRQEIPHLPALIIQAPSERLFV